MRLSKSCALALLLALPAQARVVPFNGASPQSAAFEKLRSLVGTWNASTPGGPSVRFEMVAGGSTLMETMTGTGGSTMVTMYHPDGAKVGLTHYCSMGDQPRMLGELSGESVRFTFVDVTNLQSQAVPYMHDLAITWMSHDHIVEHWTMASGKTRTAMLLDLQRLRS